MTATQNSVAAAIAAQPLRAGSPARRAGARAERSAGLARKAAPGQPAGARPATDSSPHPPILKDALELRREMVDARRDKKDGEADSAKAVGAALKLPAIYRPVYIDEAFARFSHAVTTDRPFLERLTQFWSNHFAVSIDKIAVLGHRGRDGARGHPPACHRQLHAPVDGGRKASGHAAVPRQPDLDRTELARGAIHRTPRQGQRPQARHQRKPGA